MSSINRIGGIKPPSTPVTETGPAGGTTAVQAKVNTVAANTIAPGMVAALKRGPHTLTVDSIVDQAKKAGLTPAEQNRLRDKLTHSPDQPADLRLLRDIQGSPNQARALRAFMDVSDVRTQKPARITSDVMRSLVDGVATARTSTSQGREGILSQDTAQRAARTLADMPQNQYNQIRAALNQVGKKSPETEKALILKAVAARHDQLTNPGLMARILDRAGYPTATTRDITDFAKAIRGQDRKTLVNNSSVMDLNVDGVDSALQQRWNDSCAPTTAQIGRAEADPIYALKLHGEAIHTTNNVNSPIAAEQKRVLENNGGTAVNRGAAGGAGMNTNDAVNDLMSKVTGRTYSRTEIANTAAGRQAALNDMEALIEKGVDVPVSVGWNSGGGHAMLFTDVRTVNGEKQFLVTDPWNGRTGWIKGQDIVNGNTNFWAGTGRLRAYMS